MCKGVGEQGVLCLWKGAGGLRVRACVVGVVECGSMMQAEMQATVMRVVVVGMSSASGAEGAVVSAWRAGALRSAVAGRPNGAASSCSGMSWCCSCLVHVLPAVLTPAAAPVGHKVRPTGQTPAAFCHLPGLLCCRCCAAAACSHALQMHYQAPCSKMPSFARSFIINSSSPGRGQHWPLRAPERRSPGFRA